MNRVFVLFAVPLGALMPLVFDSALKGAVLLVVAALMVLAMGRASASARHLVWLVAVVALLVVPLLSVALPQWRILPRWAASPLEEAPRAAAAADIGAGLRELEPIGGIHSLTPSAPPPWQGADSDSPTPGDARLRPGARAPSSAFTSGEAARSWLDWIPLVWAAGLVLLALRLWIAHWMLRRATRRCSLLGARSDQAMIAEFSAACAQLGIRRRVTVLLDAGRAMPVVWGVLRPRLLLPAEAREWSREQLRSVVLHELSHIRRRDPLVQWLTQIACALHWWNPLVWLAAWRLHVERERACDDLVLAVGVRPSAYAEHLLHVATRLAPARWTAPCGLAMARRSSLEGRLLAVLSEGLNRRHVTGALAATALLLGAGVSIPIAMLRAAEADKPEAESVHVSAEPSDPTSKALFEDWKAGARRDGKIPGGRIGELAASLKTFMDLNPGHEQSMALEPLLEKCDATRDWSPADAAALLDEIAAVSSQAEWTLRAITERTIHPGRPLPDELADAPWGPPAESGLRMAWLLEPRAETQALDSVMKSRVLFHNTGNAPVCFATVDWIQSGGHTAEDANGEEIRVWAVSRLGMRTRMIFRLAPGEYAEVEGHGIGVGPHETSSEKSIRKVGCWIEAKEGDLVTFKAASLLVSFQTWINDEGRKDSVTVWNEMIAARVRREGPMPASPADRELLLRRVMRDFPGAAPTEEEIAAFTSDDAPDALARLIDRLQSRFAAMHFAGELSAGETTFRVAPAGDDEEQEEGADARMQPKDESAQSLFRKWKARARTDGKIPGALIGQLAREVDSFLQRYPESEEAPQLAALRPRLDASRDWTQEEAIALLDEITAIATAPVGWIDTSMRFAAMRFVQGGQPLPVELRGAAWGPPAENGLRSAWLLEPRAERYPLGSVLKARVLFHNTGNAPVLFKTETWHQYDDHIARDAAGAEIPISRTRYSGITPMATYRLAPGEYCEVLGHGIAIGAGDYTEERSTGSVGAVIEAKEGDTVSLSHRVDTATGGWTRPDDPKDPAELWKATIAERVANEAPMPASAADRKQLIRRVTLDLFGVEPTAEEIAAFIADDATDALARLTARLQDRPHLEPWAGHLPTGATPFRVVAANPDAATAPRSANSPGRYVLGDNVHLLVSQRTEGGRRTNKAVIAFLSPDPKVASPHEPYEIVLPEGLAGYGIVWERGAGELWVAQSGLVRRYEFSNPAEVKEMRIEPGGIRDVPAHLSEALKEAFDLAGGPELPSDPNSAPASSAPADASQGIDWSEFPSYETANPFDPQQAVRLAAAPERSEQDIRRLMFLILQGAAEKSPELRPLLHDEALKRSDDAFHSLALALAAYDYSVNGSEKALQFILDELAREPIGSDAQAAVPLGFIDEWDLSIAAHEKHFARTDGAGGLAYALFWERRRHLYPEKYARFLSERLAAAKLDAGSLRGVWTGERDGVRVELRMGQSSRWEVSEGDRVTEAELTTRPWPNGKAISLMAPREKEGRVPCGRLWRGEDGTLRIDVWPEVSENTRYPGVSDIVLDRVSGEQPEAGAQLEPAIERKLQWGEPSNGLRMALAWPATLGEPALGQAPEFWLVVQNVSEAEVRLTANEAAPNPRRLMMRENGRTLQAIRDPLPTPGDWRLQPREVAFLRLFQSDSDWKDGKTISSAIEQDIRSVPRFSMTAEMSIEKAPAGAWTGKLVTGRTRGSADVTQSEN